MTSEEQLQAAGIQFEAYPTHEHNRKVLRITGTNRVVQYYPEEDMWFTATNPKLNGFGLNSLIVGIKEGTI